MNFKNVCFQCLVPFKTSCTRPELGFRKAKFVSQRRPKSFCSFAPVSLSISASSGEAPFTVLEEELSPLETFRVSAHEAGKRLDKLISERFNERSRTYIQSLLSSSCVTVDDSTVTTKSVKPCVDQLITVRFLPIQRDLPLIPESIPLNVVYEDPYLVIVNKPAGMVIHPAPGNWTGTLVHTLCYHYPEIASQGGPRPGIVHRLDKGTSGLIVVARTPETAAAMSARFANRQVRKQYIAITVGNPAGKGCVGRSIDAAIGRCPIDRFRMTILDENAGGRPAHSTVRAIAHDSAGLLHVVCVNIETGRTHQIRVHLRHVRAPVLGDDLYGARDVNRRFASAATRPMLHAQRLTFEHPITGKEIDVTAPLSDDMHTLLRRVVYPNFETETDW